MNRKGLPEPVVALGLMSGTSLDGIDAALIETDGVQINEIGLSHTFPYPDEFRKRLSAEVKTAGSKDRPTTNQELIEELTRHHIDAVRDLLSQVSSEQKWSRPDVVGFHGHTTLHRPDQKFTQQVGNAELLANKLKLPVVFDFRSQDVLSGGQGAPLAPIFHSAMASGQKTPIAIVNIGGIANLTWIGNSENEILAFDTGPGNSLLDMWMEERTGARYDEKGETASAGQIDEKTLKVLLQQPFFEKTWPKSLDRSDFSILPFENLNLKDGAATIAEFTVRAIAYGLKQCPSVPNALFVSGGGRHNRFMMKRLSESSPCDVGAVEDMGWNGDSVEAQAFAFLAVRSLQGLPITFPGTTGVDKPLSGGTLVNPNEMNER